MRDSENLGLDEDPYLGNLRARVPIEVEIRDANPDEDVQLTAPHLTVSGVGHDRLDCVRHADAIARQYWYGEHLVRWVGPAKVVGSEFSLESEDPTSVTFETDVVYKIDRPTRVRAV